MSDRPVRVLEIGFFPLLSRAFPEQVQWINTSLQWKDTRCYKRDEASFFRRVGRLCAEAARGFAAASRQDYDVVVTRCLGSVNSFGRPIWVHLVRTAIGWGLEGLARYAARGTRVRLAVIDLADEGTIHPRDRRLFWRSNLYFKRELADNLWHTLETVLPRGAVAGVCVVPPLGSSLTERLRPISLGIDESAARAPIPAARKSHDVFYSGLSSLVPSRVALPAILDDLKARGWRVAMPRERLDFEQYREMMAGSRLCLSPGGVGWDCFRHYEAVAFGSVPVFDFRSIRQRAPFRHGVDCFYVDSQDDVASRIDEFLKTPDATLDAMAAAAQRRLNEHFTFHALARYVMAELAAVNAAASSWTDR